MANGSEFYTQRVVMAKSCLKQITFVQIVKYHCVVYAFSFFLSFIFFFLIKPFEGNVFEYAEKKIRLNKCSGFFVLVIDCAWIENHLNTRIP